MSWKELAIGLAKENAHELWCPFRGCQCGAVDRRELYRAEVMENLRDEQLETTRT